MDFAWGVNILLELASSLILLPNLKRLHLDLLVLEFLIPKLLKSNHGLSTERNFLDLSLVLPLSEVSWIRLKLRCNYRSILVDKRLHLDDRVFNKGHIL